MGFTDVWNRTLVYFGIAEEDEDWDEDGYVTNEELERSYAERERANVRRLQPRRASRDFDEWSEPAAPAPRAARNNSSSSARAPRPVDRERASSGAPAVRVHLVLPRSFNDAQQIADKFK